jgi:hypothetical protein
MEINTLHKYAVFVSMLHNLNTKAMSYLKIKTKYITVQNMYSNKQTRKVG